MAKEEAANAREEIVGLRNQNVRLESDKVNAKQLIGNLTREYQHQTILLEQKAQTVELYL